MPRNGAQELVCTGIQRHCALIGVAFPADIQFKARNFGALLFDNECVADGVIVDVGNGDTSGSRRVLRLVELNSALGIDDNIGHYGCG